MTMTEGNLLSLSQAVSAGLFVSIAAARKAAHRDPRFPEPMAKRGSTFLYDAAALQAYRSSSDRPGRDLPSIPLRHDELPPPVEGAVWKPIPGAQFYEASHRGKIRSVNRRIDGKFYRGQELATRINNSGYEIVNIRTDDGGVKTSTVHSLVLLAHVGEPPPEEETLHGPGGPLDNRWPENIRYGTHPENVAERVAAAYKEPKAPTPCINHDRCGNFAGRGGKRCRQCIVDLGVAAAVLFAEGKDPDQVAAALSYSSPNGVYRHAVTHGGLRVRVDSAAIRRSDAAAVTQRNRRTLAQRLRSVIIGRGASRQNSDAR